MLIAIISEQTKDRVSFKDKEEYKKILGRKLIK